MTEPHSQLPEEEIEKIESSSEGGDSDSEGNLITKQRDPRFFPPISSASLRNNIYSRFITYSIERIKNITWRGFRYHYRMYFLEKALYHTKTKTKKPSDPIWISKGTETHFSRASFEGCLLSNADQSLFSLRERNEYGKEMMTVEITVSSRSEPRKTVVNVFEEMEFVPSRVESMKPVLSKSGNWELSFIGKPCISSIKNCILVGSDSLPYFMVRRVSEGVIEIDTPQIFPSMCVFGLAISTWIS